MVLARLHAAVNTPKPIKEQITVLSKGEILIFQMMNVGYRARRRSAVTPHPGREIINSKSYRSSLIMSEILGVRQLTSSDTSPVKIADDSIAIPGRFRPPEFPHWVALHKYEWNREKQKNTLQHQSANIVRVLI